MLILSISVYSFKGLAIPSFLWWETQKYKSKNAMPETMIVSKFSDGQARNVNPRITGHGPKNYLFAVNIVCKDGISHRRTIVAS